MDHLVLGKSTNYSEYYDAGLLQAVPRKMSRDAIKLPKNLPFTGVDIWNAYEVSWLNARGKPVVAIMQCDVPIDSENLIESKSFKLYLNSFNQSVFNSSEDVLNTLRNDLSECAGKSVTLSLIPANTFNSQIIGDLPPSNLQNTETNANFSNTILLDNLDITIDDYTLSPSSLSNSRKTQTIISETLVSHLLKSNCLITNQPDWGSVLIRYTGKSISHEKLLRYLISFRNHNEFHEQCVERIFYDIYKYCKPTCLTVYARYTRRGGLDINPFRSNFEKPYSNIRLARQ